MHLPSDGFTHGLAKFAAHEVLPKACSERGCFQVDLGERATLAEVVALNAVRVDQHYSAERQADEVGEEVGEQCAAEPS